MLMFLSALLHTLAVDDNTRACVCDMTAVSWIFGVALVAWVAGLPVRTWSAWELGSRELPGDRAAGSQFSPR